MLLQVALFITHFAVSRAENRSCEQDWSYYNMSCYFRDVKRKTFTDAQANCESKQANLVTVNDIYEQEFLKTFMGKAGGWNGLNSQNSTNSTNRTFEWVSGETVNFTYWSEDQPDTEDHCVHMYKVEDFKWRTKACSSKHKSICEKDWRPCDTKPCQNGGTCIPNVDDYSCQCLDDFLGKNCELRSTTTIPAISSNVKITSVSNSVVISQPTKALSEKKDVIETPSILKVTSYPSTLVSMAITSSPSTEPTVMVTPSYKEPGMTPVPTSVPKPLTDGETDANKQSKQKGYKVINVLIPLLVILLLFLLIIALVIWFKKRTNKKEKLVDGSKKSEIIWL